jgi:hypothetical protein
MNCYHVTARRFDGRTMLWSESAQRYAGTAKAAAVMAGMPRHYKLVGRSGLYEDPATNYVRDQHTSWIVEFVGAARQTV